MNTPMSRREEVEAEMGKVWAHRNLHEVPIHLNQLARTLADEVDELRKENERIKQNHGCARHQHTTQFCTEAAQRDAVITKLLAMLEPGGEPNYMAGFYRSYEEYELAHNEW